MLEAIHLTNFKSFPEAKVHFGPFTLIVGTNASGKSNIREALRFLHGVGLGYSVADVLGEKYGPGGVLQWRGIRGGAHEVSYQNRGNFMALVGLGGADDGGGPLTTAYSVTVDVSDATLGPRVERELLISPFPEHLVFTTDTEPVIKSAGPHEARVFYPPNQASAGHGKLSAYSSARPLLTLIANRADEPPDARTRCQAIADVFASMRFLDLDPEAMRIPSQPGQTILGDRGENLSSVLQAICHNKDKRDVLLEWVRALTPMDVSDLVFKHDLTGRVLVYLVEANGFEVSAYSASDGTLRFLALLAALLGENSGRIFFFEELDNGIHPTRLHLLLDLIQTACQTLGVQVIGTTHNPALLAFLDEQAREDAVLVYRSENIEGSQLVRIMDLPGAREIVESKDLGRLMQSGWLENAAAFSENLGVGDHGG